MGAEATPTLCYSIPAYAAFITMWENLRDNNFDWEPIIQPGLDKLEDYQACLVDTPAYVVAMGERSIFYYLVDCQLNIIYSN